MCQHRPSRPRQHKLFHSASGDLLWKWLKSEVTKQSIVQASPFYSGKQKRLPRTAEQRILRKGFPDSSTREIKDPPLCWTTQSNFQDVDRRGSALPLSGNRIWNLKIWNRKAISSYSPGCRQKILSVSERWVLQVWASTKFPAGDRVNSWREDITRNRTTRKKRGILLDGTRQNPR